MERLLISLPGTYPKISPAALSTRPKLGLRDVQGESTRTPTGSSVADDPPRRGLEKDLRALGQIDPLVDVALGGLLDPSVAAPLVRHTGGPDLLRLNRCEQGTTEVGGRRGGLHRGPRLVERDPQQVVEADRQQRVRVSGADTPNGRRPPTSIRIS